MTNWDALPALCSEAKQAATVKPGRYGGRYIGRRYLKQEQRDELIILDDDDPATVPDYVDVLAHVTPAKVWPVGSMRHFMDENGNVDFGD